MHDLKQFELWFLTGSQTLYGEATLLQVTSHSQLIGAFLDRSPGLPVRVVWKPTVKSPEEIFQACEAANQEAACVGIITWMHTFSPAKMWIRGLGLLRKPLLHLHTQFNRDIPWHEIDMDFMNLNQSAHGDREFAHLAGRMRIPLKVVVGHWQDPEVLDEIQVWARAATAWQDWQGARFARFGDNMRQVAVTEGDKVEAECRFGYSVNTYGIGDLAEVIRGIPEAQVEDRVKQYSDDYVLAEALRPGASRHGSLRDAAKIELGLESFLIAGRFKGFTDTFEDLHGLEQLPGIAVQRLMARGFGFAAEGDWKTAALVRAIKVMAVGLPGGSSFMEDYTYHFDPENPLVLGAHMLEICESLAEGKPSCEIHPLGIGGKSDPVRLVFNAKGGPAINASLVDLGPRFRLVINEVYAVPPPHPLPKLPVARVLWKPYPDLKKGCTAWLLAGGAHHTVFSQSIGAAHLLDFARIAGIECVRIGAGLDMDQFRNELRWNDVYFQINR
jgi:L-arabinose isomerase